MTPRHLVVCVPLLTVACQGNDVNVFGSDGATLDAATMDDETEPDAETPVAVELSGKDCWIG